MDERHWWIAGKIQESFHIGGFDNPTMLEDFMCEEQTLQLINEFLSANGPCRIFFYCDKAEAGELSTRELHITSTLANLKDVVLTDITVLYFLRRSVTSSVDMVHFERDIFCGELKHNTMDMLNSLLSDIYLPLFKSQKDWGDCTEENKSHLIHNVDRLVTSLSESAGGMHSTKQLRFKVKMLKQPENIISNDFKMTRLAALDQSIITEYEDLVNDWMTTIETILTDTSDERFMDPMAGPLSELDRWRRRQRLLSSITEQLKTKECKAVIGVLITAKSRLLKRWKAIDASITDAMNETKDKVKYLESLRRHLDQLYHGATPTSIMNIALPGLINSVKQMDSISRFYARSGFLGLFFTKVTNQLVLACKEYIQACTLDKETDTLWEKVDTEVTSREHLDNPAEVEPQQRHLRVQVESRLTKSGKTAKTANLGSRLQKTKDSKDLTHPDESLFQRLRSCVLLQTHYRESVRALREALGGSHVLSHFQSISTLGGHANSDGSHPPGSVHKVRTSQASPSKKPSSVIGDNLGHGVSIADEEAVIGHLDNFCSRLRQVMDVINTLSQYHKMALTTDGLPRPRKEDFIVEEPEEDKEHWKQKKRKDSDPVEQNNNNKPVSDFEADMIGAAQANDSRNLVAIVEHEEGVADEEEAEETSKGHADEVHLIAAKTSMTMEDINVLKLHYDENDPQNGPSVSGLIRTYLRKLTSLMSTNVTTKTMLDVESKDKDNYEDTYTKFLVTVQEMERFLGAYLNILFLRKIKTWEGLDVLMRFTAIQPRPGIRVVIAEKYAELFVWYESDLEDVREVYDELKESPPRLRNAPPVAGAIHWSRQLLRQIEEPMKIFRDNRTVTGLVDFGRVVKSYNKIATALVTFESLWYSQWKTQIEHVKSGLRATLLIHHPETRHVVVNADDRILELIHESKWLTRLGIQIPEGAQHVLNQEQRFKKYKSHLELCLEEFQQVVDSIPDGLEEMFTPHVDQVTANFQPGLSTLAWNSMNIDAFLHQIHVSTANLKLLVEGVNNVMKKKVEDTIQKIKEMFLFNYDLAFSKAWPPGNFTEQILESVSERSALLCDYVKTIESGMQEMVSMLTKRKLDGDTFAFSAIDKPDGFDSQEDRQVADLLKDYCNQIYDAVLFATTRSLVTLAEASGCQGETVRSVSAMSQHSLGSNSSSRVQSAKLDRPQSVLSMLSDMTWSTEKAHEITYLQFRVEVKFSIPNIIIEPPLEHVQSAVSIVGKRILAACRGIKWIAGKIGQQFFSSINEDPTVVEIMEQLSNIVPDLQDIVQTHLHHFSLYDFLWKDDMHGNYYDFIKNDPGTFAMKREVERLLRIEKKVLAIPSALPVGPICMHTDPVKNALHGFAMAWKTKYASVLHEEAKKKLDAATLYRMNVRNRLELTVHTLDQLNSTLHLLEEVADMENKIDDIYLPIEAMYAKLREFELRLPRSEVQEVDQLRDKWQDLLDLAGVVRKDLLKEKRGVFEQELDKQVKTFVVEVIQFRNAFDAQGPAVPGIPPEEAVERLHDFQHRYGLFEAKRKTLDSVSKLFGIVCKPFPELDKTGEELVLLGQLYGLFQKFIRFDNRFKDTLWAEVHLEESNREVESYWDECLALPSKLKDWDAYTDMKGSIQEYLDVFPLLHRLASKEIRSRHWLQVMQVTGSSFQLEANVFKLSHLLDIGLIKHKTEIEGICHSAAKEMELEVKMRITEEEWTEQVLTFEHYKKLGPIYLDKGCTERLLEQLEDAEALLANMLTSKYVAPLREEAASWAEKLKEVGEVLELWLEVQDLWQYLEAVFSNGAAAKELPQEANRFSRIDKGWIKMMKRAYDTRNVLQCCYGGEVPKGVVLRHIFEELEICFKSLQSYLDGKRKLFPRFYFVSDSTLIAILSRPHDLDSVKPHLRTLFSNVADVELQKTGFDDAQSISTLTSNRGSRTQTPLERGSAGRRSTSPLVPLTATKIDKRLTTMHNKPPTQSKSTNINPVLLNTTQLSTMLPSEGITVDHVTMEAVAVISTEGELLQLQDQIALEDGVEVWLSSLKECISDTLKEMSYGVIEDSANNVAIEEWALKYPVQVCKIGLLYHWTRECEAGVNEIKYDRRAIQNAGKRFQAALVRLPTMLARNQWKGVDEVMLPVHRLRLEGMMTMSLYLRDASDSLSSKKIREPTDFEWRRNFRCYVQDNDGMSEPVLYVMDNRFKFGTEFHGAAPMIGMSTTTERCLLTMIHCFTSLKGSCITGGTGVGKTETVKALAQTLGVFLSMQQCYENMEPAAVGRVIQGLSLDGSWGCFDEVQSIRREVLSVVLDLVQTVYSALKARHEFCYFSDGQEVTLNKSVSFFMTLNPTTALPSYTVPNDLRTSFRQVSLVMPDFGQVLKNKCCVIGLKAPTALALRLKIVTDLAKDLLPEEFHNQFSVAALTGVLQRAAQKRKNLREDRAADRESKYERERKDAADLSRSNSQASVAVTGNLISYKHHKSGRNSPTSPRPRSASPSKQKSRSPQQKSLSLKNKSRTPKQKPFRQFKTSPTRLKTRPLLYSNMATGVVANSPAHLPQYLPSFNSSSNASVHGRSSSQSSRQTTFTKTKLSPIKQPSFQSSLPKIITHNSTLNKNCSARGYDYTKVRRKKLSPLKESSFSHRKSQSSLSVDTLFDVESDLKLPEKQAPLKQINQKSGGYLPNENINANTQELGAEAPSDERKSTGSFHLGCLGVVVMAMTPRSIPSPQQRPLPRAETRGQSRKANTPNPLTPAAKLEHSMVGQALLEVIGPRLTGDNLMVFKSIVKDIFTGLPEAPKSYSARSRTYDIESAIEQQAVEQGLIAHKPWVEKCMQLYTVSSLHQGVIVAGPPGSGKTSCIQTLVDALCISPRGISRHSHSTRMTNPAEVSHKLQRINPMVVEDSSLMFGHLSINHDWVDGIFTSAWKKANRNQSTTWLCLDGPLNASWADNFSSVLNPSKTLHLRNGDRLFMSDNVKLLFETTNLSEASPATVAKSGIVFVDKDVVGWNPIAQAWLEDRTQQEVHVLTRAFNKTVDAVSNYVLQDAKPSLKLSEIGMFTTCLKLLSAMLADNIEIGGEMHIERLYLFCLIWTFGGLLEKHEQKGFSDLLKTLSSAAPSATNVILPDDDRDICVYDYYVDESGEWDPWLSRVPEAVYTDNQDILGEVFVDTVDTVRTRILMEFAAASGQNVLLVGPQGSGKTSMINYFVDSQDPQQIVTKRLVFSAASKAQQLQTFVEANIYHRQGFVYGAKENKRLQMFIDDLNLPTKDEYGVQKCNELLRQMVDSKVLCTLEKPFEWRTIEGLSIFSAMSMSPYPSMVNQILDSRLLRHFAVFCLPAASGDSLKSVVNGILEANMLQNDHPGLDIDLHHQIVDGSVRVLTAVQKTLRPSPMPGRFHYLFSLRDITVCFQGLKRLVDEHRAEDLMVVSLWRHEIQRIMRDRLCRQADLTWFDGTLVHTIRELWPSLEEDLHEHFVTFPIDTRMYNRPVTTNAKKEIRVMLQPVSAYKELHNCLQAHLTRYNEEFGNVELKIMLSDNIIEHVVRMHRILSFHHGGNILVIGAVGAHLTTLAKLALHVADLPIHYVDTSKQNTFFDGLRSAVRLSGSEGKILTLLFCARDLRDDMYMDAINSLLVCGEYPHLFSNDELDGLLQAIGPALKREHPNLSADPMKFFVSRVKCNLHIVLCLQPNHPLLKTMASQYPGLLSGCQLSWMCDWPQESLLGEASYYITKYNLCKEGEDMSESVTTCLANIHSFALRDSKQTIYAGVLDPEVPITQVSVHEKKKEVIKTKVIKVPNLPYSKLTLLEHVRHRHVHPTEKSKNEVFVGPSTYHRFMHCFRQVYSAKAKSRRENVTQLKKVIATLDQTRTDAKVMKQNIKNIKAKFEGSKVKTATLLHDLTAQATKLEKLKARVGMSTSLSAFLQLNELSSDEEEDDALLHEEQFSELENQLANLKTRQVRAVEELVVAKQKVDECRQRLDYARQQVLHWKGKVDRACIERLKNFSNPPVLVGHVMEMVMTLIGKRLPSTSLKPGADTSKDDLSGRMSASSSSTKVTQRKGIRTKEMPDKFERGQWKVMQMAMSDTIKFVDMLHNISWEDGLDPQVVTAVESYLSKGTAGELGVTGEGSLLENAQDTKFVANRRSPSPDNTRGITITAAKFSSEDAAALVQYTIAIIEYTHLCGPLKAALEKQHELEREIEENERQQKEKEHQIELVKPKVDSSQPSDVEDKVDEDFEEELVEEDIPRVQAELDTMQRQFDLSVVEKHTLEIELVSMNERLKAATSVLESLKPQEKEWRKHVKDNDSSDLLLANCIAAAAYLVYCGPLGLDTRARMGEFFMYVCDHHGLPLPSNQLFRNMSLAQFLYDSIQIKALEQLKLPTSPLMLENACFIMQEESSTAWPLLCDPTNKVIDWVKCFKKNDSLHEVKYAELRSQLETCLSEGFPLLVTDVDDQEISNDKRFLGVLRAREKFIKGKQPFKLWVGDHEVECDPKFRLYLHTSTDPYLVLHELACMVAVVSFNNVRSSTEEELLDYFMAKEKARLEEERMLLLQEHIENMTYLKTIEMQMRELLSSDTRLLNDLSATKKLAELKKHHDETLESQSRVEASQQSIMRAREGYRSIAQRGAVCFDAAQYIREVNLLYQTSYKQFLDVYDAAISHSERAAVKAVVERLTYSSYLTTSRSLLEKDKLIYAVLLALEIEDSLGHVGPGDRECLISPQYGAIVMTAVGAPKGDETKIMAQKKPFDWMTDDTFHNLQMLAIHFEWFQDMFDRLSKDGRETQWRNLCESDAPENVPLPDKMDDQFSPVQRLLLLRSVRSDRLIQASTSFIGSVLGKKYNQDNTIDFPMMLRQSSPLVPILLMYSSESETAEKLFVDFAKRKQSQYAIVPLFSIAGEKNARKQLLKAMTEGSWVLLQHSHNVPSFLAGLQTLLSEQHQVDPQFRCWIAAQIDPCLPTRILQTAIKVVVDSPKAMKDNLVRSFSWVDADTLRACSRSEWPVVLHNLCYIHGAIKLRARFEMSGFNAPYSLAKVSDCEFFESLQLALNEFTDNLSSATVEGRATPRNTSWSAIRFILSEIIYGSHVVDLYDQMSLSSMVDYWISPTALKKDFELPRVKYRHPPVFFSSHARLTSLMQALEGLASYNLDVPEACHIHPNIEIGSTTNFLQTILGDDQYIFTRLNKVYDGMPSSATLKHKLFPRPPTPFHGAPLASVSALSTNPYAIWKGVFASASFAAMKMRKDVELWEICHTVIPKVPKAYSKEYVTERVKKVGGFTPFNVFIMKELETMYALLIDIKSTLQSIKASVEVNSLGDLVSPRTVSAADDLFHMRIPEIWRQMAGLSAPPQQWTLAQWLVDLANRCQHFERILVLGREKMPAYWLGAFFNPRALLTLLKQDCYRHHMSHDRTGSIETLVLQTEVTNRDKDHGMILLRDPPHEGMFVYGIYIWGCAWEKTTGELQDSPPRHGCTSLPVVHVTCWPQSEKPIIQDPVRAAETYQCPCYPSRIGPRVSLMEIDVRHENISATRWALRGLSATIRPY